MLSKKGILLRKEVSREGEACMIRTSTTTIISASGANERRKPNAQADA
jgi:hypothetical protein